MSEISNKRMMDFELDINDSWVDLLELSQRVYDDYSRYNLTEKISFATQFNTIIEGAFAKMHIANDSFGWFMGEMKLFFNDKMSKEGVSRRIKLHQNDDANLSFRNSQLWKIEKILDSDFYDLCAGLSSISEDIPLANRLKQLWEAKKRMFHLMHSYYELLFDYSWYVVKIEEEMNGSRGKNGKAFNMKMSNDNSKSSIKR